MSDSERQHLEEALQEKDRLLKERDAKIAELEKQLERLQKVWGAPVLRLGRWRGKPDGERGRSVGLRLKEPNG
jgi:hypothetical protein